MDTITIEKTKSSPFVLLDPNKHVIRIKGQSYPENAAAFYEPIFAWIEKYMERANETLTVEIYLAYLNTSSTKAIMTMFDMLEDAYSRGRGISIQWHYDSDNEMGLEYGEDFKEDLTVPFTIIETDDSSTEQ